ncbi:1,2-phenylacetyl-CoA epoxidase subunit PaaE [Halobaculum sp. MBLA0143]|uniref:1,2-phenylacetyl-CoA epoxidase subunit PaaE n=1 Tax=Halobaculum sp. MBLA0143 TaxID=3079933 RepID=UPI003524913F
MSETPTPSAPTDDDDPSTTTSGETSGVECPYCGSTETERDHPQGPSSCRSMHFCRDCGQPFERFG